MPQQVQRCQSPEDRYPLIFWTPPWASLPAGSTSACTGWGWDQTTGYCCRPGTGVMTCKEQLQSTFIPRTTDYDGRAKNFLTRDQFTAGIYRVHFSTKQYFEQRGVKTFYPHVEVRKLPLSQYYEYYHLGNYYHRGPNTPLPYPSSAQPIWIHHLQGVIVGINRLHISFIILFLKIE